MTSVDPATIAWFSLDETLQARRRGRHPAVRKFVRTPRSYQASVVDSTSTGWPPRDPWRQRLAANVPTPAAQVCFERTVARVSALLR
ncbi:hypothetical protein [Candidatus Amarolinea dominans]|uniref:hypothetical protein n=1 Tax=Candidatus Amarolinea dominans TaxID=3140696 RepID=UPI001D7DD190|nr:hypothetical protein [Anaerolineae bacterium]